MAVSGLPIWVPHPSYTFFRTTQTYPPHLEQAWILRSTPLPLPGDRLDNSFVLRSELNRAVAIYHHRSQQKAESGFGTHRLTLLRLLDACRAEATPAT